jgi:hypothetical protein
MNTRMNHTSEQQTIDFEPTARMRWLILVAHLFLFPTLSFGCLGVWWYLHGLAPSTMQWMFTTTVAVAGFLAAGAHILWDKRVALQICTV